MLTLHPMEMASESNSIGHDKLEQGALVDDSSSTVPSPWTPAKFDRNDETLDEYSLRKELIPYLPYVDKAGAPSMPEAQEPLSNSLKHSAWIDFGMIRNWIAVCNKHHAGHCLADGFSPTSPWHGPLWLIDAMDRCLVPADPSMKYFALSYVWGAPKGPESELCLLKSNLESMQQQGYLRNEKEGPELLPRLIDDVIELVIRLSWRYLWIDRYCIVQDDGPAKGAQINSMNFIYAGAYATIVFAEGASGIGLKGIKGQSEPRGSLSIMDHVTQTPVRSLGDDTSELKSGSGWRTIGRNWLHVFRDRIQESSGAADAYDAKHNTLSRTSSVDSFDSFVISDGSRQQIMEREQTKDRKVLEAQAYLLMHSQWYSRGWTFQEALFSRRKIVFQNDTVNWECHCVAWYEGQESVDSEIHAPCTRRPGFIMDLGFDSATWPDLYRYARLVCLFNRRQLTFPEDVLFAFAGVVSSLARTFHYGFISGLPQMFFHSTLIWQPYRPVERRTAKNTENPILPSWSWAGWQGVLQYESWRSGYSYVKSLATEQDLDSTTWLTFETVKWYRLDDAKNKHDIRCIEKAGPQEQAYNGWHSSVSPETGLTVYSHKDIPQTEFWHPVPLRDPIKAHVPPIYCRLLAATTRHASVKAGESFQDATSSRCTAVDLLNNEKQWVGVLRLPMNDANSELYELIELSSGSVRKHDRERVSFDEWERPGFQRCWKNDTYDFVNVMAISWSDGVAYREAVGRVEKSCWEALDTVMIDIMLG